ncbi:MAG TPA: SUMF1/EgtB/PvdO family nonheme iron enzyme [Labilithrix sp.]|nr:SUMF1/EgtB/PvdO family nonheme iron enzyme [Labilithrix sp.]
MIARRPACLLLAGLAGVLAAAGCKRTAETAEAGATSSAPDAAPAAVETDAAFVSAVAALDPITTDAGTVRSLLAAPAAGKTVDIPAGSFPSGSTPGEEGRDPTVEPALVDVTLGAFTIDALPFPNDPALPVRTGVSVEEAVRLCRDRGARLCSELEWERACKGPEAEAFATGARWNPLCDKEPARCASGFGVRAMGVSAELTDSRFATAEGESAPVLRGAARRCGARTRTAGGETTFRCCRGPSNAAKVPAMESRPGFKKLALEPAQLAKIFAQVPELLRIGHDLRYFTEGDVKAMKERTGAAHDGITFVTSPILWSPETGAELLVAAGRGKTMSFVVALWTLPGDRYRFASAFLMLNDLSPVALAFEPARRKELRWTSCWGCPGEQGLVSYRPEDHRVVIVQQ